ncbi:hypothetical protein PD885_00654 [Xanthomonas fragariae]|uniref:Uncharacterized protein n=1 Tax=Xanthomonas fragariae TaxID=48664 RepID=A0ABY1RKX5_9XANT|nr:hypothetical protein PD885_00654 [Xanthomonas fragariae]
MLLQSVWHELHLGETDPMNTIPVGNIPLERVMNFALVTLTYTDEVS